MYVCMYVCMKGGELLSPSQFNGCVSCGCEDLWSY